MRNPGIFLEGYPATSTNSIESSPLALTARRSPSLIRKKNNLWLALNCDPGCHTRVLGWRSRGKELMAREALGMYLAIIGLFLAGRASWFLLQCAADRKGIWRGMGGWWSSL